MTPVPTLAELEVAAHDCMRCPLGAGRTNVVFGVGDPNAPLMFVGEAPGREEDLQGRPFIGRSGQLLERLIAEELGMRRDECYIANVLKCRPPDNRNPAPDEISACRPFLEQQVEAIGPKVIVTLGNFATRLLLDTKEGITKLRGRTYPYGDRVLVPTFHPAAVLQGGGAPALAKMREDLGLVKEVLAA